MELRSLVIKKINDFDWDIFGKRIKNQESLYSEEEASLALATARQVQNTGLTFGT